MQEAATNYIETIKREASALASLAAAFDKAVQVFGEKSLALTLCQKASVKDCTEA